MPELPAVEFSKQLLTKYIIGKTIKQAHLQPDEIIFKGANTETIAKEIAGKKMMAVDRYGKYLWLSLSLSLSLSGESPKEPPSLYLLMHFGMTGFVEVRDVGRMYYKSAPETKDPRKSLSPSSKDTNSDWPPRFTKMQVETMDGSSFVFGDARRLGRIQLLREDPLTVEPVSKLGYDPLRRMPSTSEELSQFYQLITKKKNVSMKSLMLDQKIAAGVGNWMADDILLHAGIHPEERSANLSLSQVQALCDAMKYVSQVAVDVNADGSRFPSNWLFNYRWPSDKPAAMSIGGHPIEKIVIGGRSTFYVPALQKKIKSGNIRDEAESGDKVPPPRSKSPKSIQHKSTSKLHQDRAIVKRSKKKNN